MGASRGTRSLRRVIALAKGWPGAVVLAAACWVMAVTAVLEKSPTFDEGAYLVGGLTQLATGDYRLNPEAGPLPQRFAALALVASGARLPPLDGEAWRTSSHDTLGHRFLYGSGNDARTLVWRARALIALFAAALVLAVFAVARSLFGGFAGILAAFLCALSPTVLGNGALVTSDVHAALFFLLSTWAFWRMLHRFTPGTVTVSALASAALFLTKMSAPIVVVVDVVLVLARLYRGDPLPAGFGPFQRRLKRTGQAGAVVVAAVTHAVVIWALVWAAFGFRFTPYADDATSGARLSEAWPTVQIDGGAVNGAISFARDEHLLPEAYLFGAARAHKWSMRRNSFLDGEFGTTGRADFFLKAFAYKTPLALMALLILAVAGFAARRSERGPAGLAYRSAPLLTLFGVYWIFSVTSGLNIGHRHLLPVYPVLFVVAGSTASLAVRSRWIALVPAVLAAWFAVSSVSARPDYLAYFNAAAGGPSGAYRHLVDSSLDWGQDLPALATLIGEGGATNGKAGEPVYLSYFGTADPAYYGIRARRLPGFIDFGVPFDERVFSLREGTYCISATMLQRVFVRHPGAWRDWYEEMYRDLRPAAMELERAFGDEKAVGALYARRPEQAWHRDYSIFADLRMGRLAECLRRREPDAAAGHSILVYRVGAGELAGCLD